jgi:hypothetical protein
MNKPLLIAVFLVTALVAVAGQSRSPAAAPGPRPSGTASLAGRLVRDNAPVARALVSINAGDGRADLQTSADDDGRFAFAGLAAARYLIQVSKPGWVTTYYGSARPGRPPGVRVAVDSGARVNLTIPMIPGAVIAARVVDDNGQPIPRLFPRLLESRMVGDRRLITNPSLPQQVGNFELVTDDRGEFRMFGLPPGTYYLVVEPRVATGTRITTSDEVRWAMQPPGDARTPAPALGPIAAYAPIYFPGTHDPSRAEPIVLGPGDIREGLTYRVGFVSVARVSGTVAGLDSTTCAGIVMTELEPKVSLGGIGFRGTASVQRPFTLQDVPPGDYRVTAKSMPCVFGDSAGPPPPQPRLPTKPTLWGETTISVAGQDIDGVSVTLASASSIAGRLVFDGRLLTPPSDPLQVRLQFVTTEGMGAIMTGANPIGVLQTATVETDGSFRIEGLAPGRYLASASWSGMRGADGITGWWFTSLRVGTRDFADRPIDVPPSTEVKDVAVVFRDRIGTVEGILTDAGRPAPEYFVMAFPVERALWTSASRRNAPPVRPGTDGHYKLPGLLAGDYYLAVLTAIDPEDAMDPAFLETLITSAIKITLGDGETKRQDLRVGR